MAKGIRSKQRQRVLAVRRLKYKQLEVKKCWEHQTKRANEGKQEPREAFIRSYSSQLLQHKSLV